MTTGVLPWEDLRLAIMLNTGFFETSKYTLDEQMFVTSGNWDGAGMSVGNLQYNWGSADRLSELFNYLLNNYDSVVKAVFGADTTRYNEFRDICLNKTRTEKVAWGGTITDWTKPSPDGHALIQPWKDFIGNLLLTPECKAKYYQMMDAYYMPLPLDLFKQLPCTSRASLASLFDLSINRGRFYSCNTLMADFDELEANEALTEFEKEAQRIYLINTRGNDTTNAMGTSASAFAPRRMAQANQGGDYFGSNYDPEVQFDINQEPATSDKKTGTGVKLGTIDVENIFLGTTPIKSVYLGANFLGGNIEPYTTSKVPDTQFRTNPNSYAGFETGPITLNKDQPLWIDVQNWVACRTYYTTDGSTPTTASNLYRGQLTFSESCTLKTLTVSVSGVAEAVKTLAITVNVPLTSWRYLKIEGYGTSLDTTTRIIEFEAWHGATNRMTGATILSSSPIDAGSTNLNTIKDGVKTTGSNTYPIWWSAVPNSNVIIDLGDWYALTKLNYYGFSNTGDQRQNRFKVFASTTNNGTDWTLLWDMSTNTTPQPVLPNGYEKTL
jgi:Chitobiase/beta-hexosaminidase C-terminal domain